MSNDPASKLDWDGAIRRLSTDHAYSRRKADARALREYILAIEKQVWGPPKVIDHSLPAPKPIKTRHEPRI